MKRYLLASLYASVVVGTGMFIVYGGAEAVQKPKMVAIQCMNQQDTA